MSLRDIAREWLQRPMVILLCGRGEYKTLLVDEFVHVLHVRSQSELDAGLFHPTIDVAIVEDAPWPDDDASTVGRLLRARGVGTVYAARIAESGARLLRERMTIDLNATRLSEHLDNVVWLALVETEVMRRDVPEWWKQISTNVAPAFMRLVIAKNGRLAPSQSTFLRVFDGVQASSEADGRAPLVAPEIPAVRGPPQVLAKKEPWADNNERTAILQPSVSLLRSLREHGRPYWGSHLLLWAVVATGVAAVTLALIHLFLR